ncbi:MAG: hypothetical protein CL944_03080 [Candidatus Diapherotrites archaeon]|uniref:Uncharacterized protein n=1 Tax=Candidatus Iainarchaeum sp. TaxID=3101447 RepID=A0A2D6LQG2_9ARCH|nr:hypothetical protein [Candidatus Diapherotrites archaeon]|tara:strand:+ start:6199 stop:6666 length:468 start_codon:yes stop_codon:yes gene_type:complete
MVHFRIISKVREKLLKIKKDLDKRQPIHEAHATAKGKDPLFVKTLFFISREGRSHRVIINEALNQAGIDPQNPRNKKTVRTVHDIAQELGKIDALKRDGLISEEEYENGLLENNQKFKELLTPLIGKNGITKFREYIISFFEIKRQLPLHENRQN